jgi:putative copper resistance protein D
VGLIVFAAMFRQWVRASEREAKREDRRLDRLDAEQVAREERDVRLAAASSLPAEQQSPP